MAQEKAAVPTPFRGLRVLLLDNDTESLLDIALKLENSSYKVTTTELATVALTILQERPHNFDLVMADTNMPEMNCFKFIKNVHLIKDYPIILMYSELKKGMLIEATTKGKCFCLKKPICLKNLKNVWQYAYRKSKYKTNIGEFGVVKVEEEGRVLEENDFENVEDGKRSVKRAIATETDERTEFKRKKLSFREIEGDENETLQKNMPSEDLLLEFEEAREKETYLERELEKTNRVQSPTSKLNRATSLPTYPSKLFETALNSKKKEFHSANSSPQREVGRSSLSEVLVDLHKQLDNSLKLEELQASAAFLKLLQEKGTAKEPRFTKSKKFESEATSCKSGN